MKIRTLLTATILALFLVIGGVLSAQQSSSLQPLSREQLSKLLPDSVFLDGERAPVQKRNAVGAQLGDDKVMLVALIDTSGFSSGYQEKYVGVVLAQGSLSFGNSRIKPGTYGLGNKKAMMGGKEAHTFVLYDLGGGVVAEATGEKDEELRPVTPIQLKAKAGAPARLYLGPYFVSISSD